MPPLVEPFRIKMVEPIPFLSRREREDALAHAGYNLFRLHASQVTIDLLTDSGTGAMSADQWAALMTGDESYAGGRSFHRFEAVVRELTGFPHILPTHQGRAAEHILFSTQLLPGQLTVSNMHFDTTAANVVMSAGEPVDLPGPDSADLDSEAPFKGNLDTTALRALLAGSDGPRVAAVVMTVTNNGCGGQPVSMGHLREVRDICDRWSVPLWLDASRFAENAFLVTQREPGYADRTPRQVAEETFRLADGCWMSLKKDGLANIGGVLALRRDDVARVCAQMLIATEGFTTYGGLAGRDLEALATGLLEVTDPAYLSYRAETASWFGDELAKAGLPVLRPTGCHAVYIDAGRLLPHLTPHQFPAHALACELYREAGVRCSEIGTLSFGRPDPHGGPDRPATRELTRLALPRRVYTRSHLEYVVDAGRGVAARAATGPGERIGGAAAAPPRFRATLEPCEAGA